MRESSVSISRQDADGVVVTVGDRQIGLTVSVEIGDDQAHRSIAHGVDCLGLKGAVAIAQQHADRVITAVDGDQVNLTVVIEVAHTEREEMSLPRRSSVA